MAGTDITIGGRFGRLTIVDLAGTDKHRKRTWLCKCDCGAQLVVAAGTLRSGHTKSCGCYRRERRPNLRHGYAIHAGSEERRVYNAWSQMRQRCDSPNNIGYKNYGQRGITYDPRWSVFDNFIADMGARPRGATLDRKDNDGPYCKGNCRWATKAEQDANKQRNRVIAFKGKKQPLFLWALDLGITFGMLSSRLKRGLSLKQALVPYEYDSHGREKIKGYDATRIRARSPGAYMAWKNMRKAAAKAGVLLDPAWERFQAFLADMGDPAPKRYLLRRDRSAAYSKKNCFWGTAVDRRRQRPDTRLLEFSGRSQTIQEWADELGLPYRILYERVHRGWTAERALTTD